MKGRNGPWSACLYHERVERIVASIAINVLRTAKTWAVL